MDRILILEDDLSLSAGLSYALTKRGYAVSTAGTVAEADAKLKEEAYSLLILDVALPDGSGFDFCVSVRRGSGIPILFLTAADEETDMVMGLDLGGDDYVVKPFKLSVLESRVNALLRRSGTRSGENALFSNGITLSLTEAQAYRQGLPLNLTATEFRLLICLMSSPNRVFTKENLYERLWDCDSRFVDDNTLSVYIRRLRVKLEDNPDRPEKIVTVRGLGYKWSAAQ